METDSILIKKFAGGAFLVSSLKSCSEISEGAYKKVGKPYIYNKEQVYTHVKEEAKVELIHQEQEIKSENLIH